MRNTNKCTQHTCFFSLGLPELEALAVTLRRDVQFAGSVLVRQLKRRDALISRRDKHSGVITAFLQALSDKRSKYLIVFPLYRMSSGIMSVLLSSNSSVIPNQRFHVNMGPIRNCFELIFLNLI
jgi:hypothetical protein